MEFCPKCSTRLFNRHRSPAVLVCPRCGFEKAGEPSKLRPSDTRQAFTECIKVIDQDAAGLRVLPIVRADCLKCYGKRAYNWAIYLSDEEETVIEVQVFRCTGCGYTWREKG
jgi:DNA-directed RNA polymerase subunit M/transcription elongation factor TFIIS